MPRRLVRRLVPAAIAGLALALAACREAPPEDAAPSQRRAAAEAMAEGGPPMPYLAAGACPFECCLYGRWTTTERITAYQRPMDPAGIAFQIEPGASFVADSGFVQVLRPGLAVAGSAFTIYEGPEVAPGDTLYLLDTVGEGYEHAWYRDSVYEVSGEFWNWGQTPQSAAADTFRARLVRPAQARWWAHVRDAHGREGWIDMDAVPGGTLRGVDGCGG